MKASELKPVLADAISHGEQILVVGVPGGGKTDIIKDVCKSLDADLITDHPAVADPTDFKGLPAKATDGSHAEFLPFGNTWRAIKAKKLTVWFVDDLGQASESVQKALMQLLLGRRLNGHLLSPQVVFVGATNNIGQKAGVTGLIEPVKSRWDSIVDYEIDSGDWANWAMVNEMPYELIAFIRSRPELLSKFEATKELTNSPSPRGWASVGRRLSRGVNNFELFCGAVGKGPATEFRAFLDLAKKAPDLDEIIKNPKKTKVPTEASILYLIATGLAMRANKENFENIYEYLERLTEPFRVLTMRDTITRNEELTKTKVFSNWVRTEGKHVINS